MTKFMFGCNHPECPPHIAVQQSVIDDMKSDLEKRFNKELKIYEDAGPGLILDFGGSVCEDFEQAEFVLGLDEVNREVRVFRFWPHQLDFVMGEINRRLEEYAGKDYVCLYGERWVLAMERRDVLEILRRIRMNISNLKNIQRKLNEKLYEARKYVEDAGFTTMRNPVPAGETV